MLSRIEIQLAQITSDNYSRFQILAHWRLTGERGVTDLPTPTEQELAFASRDGFWVWAAEHDGELVGWINFLLIPKPDARVGMIYIDELWTAPEFRRKGVAEALMEKAIQKARELSLWKLRLYVGRGNPAARSFYQRMGFSEDDDCLFCQRKP